MIFVTGGTGLVGSHIILELVRSGKSVRALKRPSSDLSYIEKLFDYHRSAGLLERVEWVDGDILDIPSLEEGMAGAVSVYHSAGFISFEKRDFSRLQQINVTGTANVVNIALGAGIEKLCYFSSIAALGRPIDHTGVITEEMEWKPSRFNTGYAISKYGGEKEVWRGIEEGLNAIIVNPSIILGISNPDKGSTRIFRTIWNGLKYYPPGINGFVDVEDVSRAAIALLDSPAENSRFILNAENISYYDLFSKIAGCFGKPAPSVVVKPWMMNSYLLYERLKSLATGKKPLITRETANTSSNPFTYSSEKIKSEIGYQFKDFDVTISELCKYYGQIFRKP
jgi:nucleoside-diphosphate-sugar epimerase